MMADFENKFLKFYEWVAVKFPEKLNYCTLRDKESAMETKALLEKYLVVINTK